MLSRTAGRRAERRTRVPGGKGALDHAGVITDRGGYGRGDEELWRQVMEELVAGAVE